MNHQPQGQRPGFTLIETTIVVLIIVILASLAFVVLGKVVKSSRSAAQRAALVSIRTGVDQFRMEFGSYPPLVYDDAPGGPVDTNNNPRIRDKFFLRYDNESDKPRHSTFSLPYYILGALGVEVDGAAGAGFTRPQEDGSFLKRGRRYDAFFDTSRNPEQVYRDPADESRVQLLDRWKNPIRFYRWLPRHYTTGALTGQVDQYFAPRTLGDPNILPQLRDASFGIVSLGPDGLTDERGPLPFTNRPLMPGCDNAPIDKQLTGDDVVEIGR